MQTIIDYAGIFDPTPFCDGVNGLIYLGRGHYDDAIISGMSMFPYVGDFAKAGKYGAKGYKAIKGGRYARTGYATGSEAAKAAAEHGWKDTGRRSHGQKVYTDGRVHILEMLIPIVVVHGNDMTDREIG